MDINSMASVAPLSKIPVSGMYAEVQSRTRQTRQEQERNTQQVATRANSQKVELESSVSRNEQKNGQDSNGIYTLAKTMESQETHKFMSKIDLFA